MNTNQWYQWFSSFLFVSLFKILTKNTLEGLNDISQFFVKQEFTFDVCLLFVG